MGEGEGEERKASQLLCLQRIALHPLQEAHTQQLWQFVSEADMLIHQLRSTLGYLYHREQAHRETVDRTGRRVVWFAVARSSLLVLVSVGQVVFLRHLLRGWK